VFTVGTATFSARENEMNKGPFAELDGLLIDLHWTRDEGFGDIRVGVGVEGEDEQVFAEVSGAVSAYLIPIIKEHIDPMVVITEAMVSPLTSHCAAEPTVSVYRLEEDIEEELG